jgi:RNA polymerase sigma-70 factor (ECF subfamily)
MMREVMELDADEICTELTITSTNLWVILYRARMALRLCLEQTWFAPGARPSGKSAASSHV